MLIEGSKCTIDTIICATGTLDSTVSECLSLTAKRGKRFKGNGLFLVPSVIC